VVLVVVVVGVGLAILSREPARDRFSTVNFTTAPKKPWKPSPKHDADANADFGVDAAHSGNVRLAGKSHGADWPSFNGSKRDNRSPETGLLPRWPTGGPPLAWVSRGMGIGFSSVAVVNGVVFTMGNKGETEAVMALDAGTGEKIWSTPIAWLAHLSAGDGPRSTPTFAAGALFAMGGYGDLACLVASSGAVRWQKNIVEEFGGRIPGWGVCESVLVDENRLICTPGGDKGTLVALDPQTGAVLWKGTVPGQDRAAYASPTFAEVGGLRQYVQFTASGTVGVRADNGAFLWRDDSASNGSANCSSPLVTGDLVFTSSDYGTGGSLVKLAASGASVSAKLVYHTTNMSCHHGDMVIVDGLLYGSNDPGILTCLELATGKLKWRTRSAGKGSVTSADGRIYLRTEAGPVVLVEATGAEYRELGRFDPPKHGSSPAWSHPVVAASRLFLRDADLLYCYDVKAAKPKE
jgi:outer membrane protein assembly factor BamB